MFIEVVFAAPRACTLAQLFWWAEVFARAWITSVASAKAAWLCYWLWVLKRVAYFFLTRLSIDRVWVKNSARGFWYTNVNCRGYSVFSFLHTKPELFNIGAFLVCFIVINYSLLELTIAEVGFCFLVIRSAPLVVDRDCLVCISNGFAWLTSGNVTCWSG